MTNHIQLINVDPVRSEQTEILVGNSVIIAKSLNLYIIIFNTYSVFCLEKGDIWKLLLGWLYSLNTSRYIYIYMYTLNPFVHSFNSLATLEAMFLKAMDEPDILLNLTPLRERRGSLQTSISHCTRFSARPSPWTQRSRKLSCCS